MYVRSTNTELEKAYHVNCDGTMHSTSKVSIRIYPLAILAARWAGTS